MASSNNPVPKTSRNGLFQVTEFLCPKNGCSGARKPRGKPPPDNTPVVSLPESGATKERSERRLNLPVIGKGNIDSGVTIELARVAAPDARCYDGFFHA